MGKKYIATIVFWDPDPGDDPEKDIQLMLKYGWWRGDHTTSVVEINKIQDYTLEDE